MSQRQIMRAVVIHRHGGPEVLKLEASWPRPVPGPGEILVKVRACGLNYLDIFARNGMPGEEVPLPLITGGDISGTDRGCRCLGRALSGVRACDFPLLPEGAANP